MLEANQISFILNCVRPTNQICRPFENIKNLPLHAKLLPYKIKSHKQTIGMFGKSIQPKSLLNMLTIKYCNTKKNSKILTKRIR